MEEYLIKSHVIKTLFSCDAEKELNKFDNVNTLVHGKTIIGALYEMYRVVSGILSVYWCNFQIQGYNVDYQDNIRSNIHKLLIHDNIDYSVKQNRLILKKAIFPNHLFSVDDSIRDKILTKYELNPDVVCDGNAILELVRGGRVSTKCVLTFLKHGANPDLYTDLGRPYFFAPQNPKILDPIIERTTCFDLLEQALNDLRYDAAKLFASILRCGKISALEYLDQNKKYNIGRFESWIKSIQNHPHLDMQTMQIYFNTPIECFSLIDCNKDVNNIVRKMILFKCNLECLTQSTITVPAYKYYDVAIIVLFLMRNQHLTILTCDVLRHITAFVFS